MWKGLGLDRGRVGTPEWNLLGDLIAPGDRVHHQAQPLSRPRTCTRRSRARSSPPRARTARSSAPSSTTPSAPPARAGACAWSTPRWRAARSRRWPAPSASSPSSATSSRRATTSTSSTCATRRRPSLPGPRRLRAPADPATWPSRARALGDPRGYRTVDLGEQSRFAEPDAPAGRYDLRFHRSHYETPVASHTRGRHEYSAPGTVLDADVVINLPKLKTHKKTAVWPPSLKSVIGLTNEKYRLPTSPPATRRGRRRA